jgi:hypothetical protein
MKIVSVTSPCTISYATMTIGASGEKITAVCVDTLHHQLALAACARMMRFGFREVVLCTDARVSEYVADFPELRAPGFRIQTIARLSSVEEYSAFVSQELTQLVGSGTHVLVFQWDGFAIDAGRWWEEFLAYDYVGAPWPDVYMAVPDRRVGNGGFSLRSRKLLIEAARLPRQQAVPEDVNICAVHGEALERNGIVFAPTEVARYFSVEHASYIEPFRTVPTFGFHGWFNFHLFFRDDDIMRLVQERTTAPERLALLGSWANERLLVSLHNAGRHEVFDKLFRLFAELSGKPDLLECTAQGRIEALAAMRNS